MKNTNLVGKTRRCRLLFSRLARPAERKDWEDRQIEKCSTIGKSLTGVWPKATPVCEPLHQSINRGTCCSLQLIQKCEDRYKPGLRLSKKPLTANPGETVYLVEHWGDPGRTEKLDQLNRAVDEDFELTGKYPQGILIGNHYRFSKPSSRKEPFTEKVHIVAKKKNFGLLTTTEIFQAIKRIIANPQDEIFKIQCRTRIIMTTG